MPKLESSPEQAVLEANAEFYAAFRERNYERMDTLWARETVVGCVHPGAPALLGRGPVMASWRAILGSPDCPRLHAVDENASVFGNSAVVTCVERSGRTRIATTNLFVRERGSWRVFHHHASPFGQPDEDRTPDRSLN